MNEKLKSLTVLCTICLIVAVLLSAVNYFTAPIIKDNENKAVIEALVKVYPGFSSPEKVDITAYPGLPENVTEAYYDKNLGGYVIKIVTTGYAANFNLLFGVSPDGEIVGSKCISSEETNGAEATYGENLLGKKLDEIDAVDTVSGSTKTTTAYKKAAKDAIGAALVLAGGSYDGRTEEEIKCDDALPSAEGKFETVFFAEYTEGLTRLYKATNNSGYVLVFGDDYIGVNDSGVVGEVTSAYASSAVPALEAILASTSTPVDASVYSAIALDEDVKVLTVELTASGNYIVTMTTKGYNSQNTHIPAEYRVPIKLHLSITADGVIICTETLEQSETDNLGSVCEDPNFYSQFNGKDEASYEGIDGISGATVTTNAYKLAVKEALTLVNAIVNP